MCIIGPSGSGKSTLLSCINHLERIDGGKVWVGGELVGYREHKGRLYELPERQVARMRQRVGMVFQHFNLFPHMTALQNIMEAPMRVKRMPAAEARQRAMELLDRVGLAPQARAVPGAAFRRRAAARRHRPRAGDGSAADAVRRADIGARSGTGGRGAGGDEGSGALGDDDDGGDARTGVRARGRRRADFHGRWAWWWNAAIRAPCCMRRRSSAHGSSYRACCDRVLSRQ